jgi:hypothetical protein
VSSYAHAFELSLTLLAGLLAVVGMLATAKLGKRVHPVD